MSRAPAPAHRKEDRQPPHTHAHAHTNALATRSAAGDGWKLAAALLAKNIGGGINFVAVAATTGVSSSALAAGLAVDNIFGLLYFPLVNFLGSRYSDAGARSGGEQAGEATPTGDRAAAGEAASTSAPAAAGESTAQQGDFGSVEDCLTVIAMATAASAISEVIAPTAALPVATAMTGAAPRSRPP